MVHCHTVDLPFGALVCTGLLSPCTLCGTGRKLGALEARLGTNYIAPEATAEEEAKVGKEEKKR